MESPLKLYKWGSQILSHIKKEEFREDYEAEERRRDMGGMLGYLAS